LEGETPAHSQVPMMGAGAAEPTKGNVMKHAMLDIETMGTSPDAPILSIGACRFDRNGIDIDNTFYRSVTLASAMDSGATMDADTVTWWMQQSDEARTAAIEGKGDLREVLGWFSAWILDVPLDGVWGNGAAFDNVIVTQSYRRLDMAVPWAFWQDRCYRTVKSLSGIKLERTGTHHNALDDAISQAHHMVAIWAEDARQKGGDA